MSNLKINNFTVVDSTTIVVEFTNHLNSNINIGNVKIQPESDVPEPSIIKVSILGKEMTIYCQPLTDMAAYTMIFKSTVDVKFSSLHNDDYLSEDGVDNVYVFAGPIEPNNPVFDYLTSYLKDSIYNIEDTNTIIYKYIKYISNIFSKGLYDIRQVKNENYLSFTVNDEEKTRSNGPFDRLDEEGAYQILRIGQTPSGTIENLNFKISSFPAYPVTLQKQEAFLSFTTSSEDIEGKFNINSFNLNFPHNPITRVNKIVFTLLTSTPNYEYDLSKYGYRINNNRYDQDFAFNYELLSDSQIKLNDKILEDPLFDIKNILKVDVYYEYKDLGRIVPEATLNIFDIKYVSREVLPVLTNVVYLKNAPIVDSKNNKINLGGVVFLDPNSLGLHKAFIKEVPFSLNALPNGPGIYSIDYSTGSIYVFGEDGKQTGTGEFPPLASYYYKYDFKSQIDFVYDDVTKELVSLPYGNLRNNSCNINFEYEQVLVPGKDYVANVHEEVLQERIQNRLNALNTLSVKNNPITNVFRIYNETSGELYAPKRWNHNKIIFDYKTPPNIQSKKNERVNFKVNLNEILTPEQELLNSYNITVAKILLKKTNIIGKSEDCLGSSINTSVSFSNTDIFQSENWFNPQVNLSTNLNKLTVGKYVIDYTNGVLYVATSGNITDFGSISYKSHEFVTEKQNIITVDDIFYRTSSIEDKNKKIEYTSFGVGEVVPAKLDRSDEYAIGDYILQVSNNEIGTFYNSQFNAGVSQKIKYVRGVFEYQDLINNKNPVNFASKSTFNNNVITVDSFTANYLCSVKHNGINHYVELPLSLNYISSNITYTYEVIRLTDSLNLWSVPGTVVPGDSLKLVLSGSNSPVTDQLVNVVIKATINNLSHVVVDYNKGDLFIDYTYLLDEIIVSYEYGENVIDFRKNKTLSPNSKYYVTYKVGALRDALSKNFGELINIPELKDLDVSYNRERYRDALVAALSSFIEGPTVASIENLVQTISKIKPDIKESMFNVWSLGNSILNPQKLKVSGELPLLPGKYNNGALINKENQSISFPMNSNLRLEEGTFQTWIIPEWNGLDNNATLNVTITKNNNILSVNEIFVGSTEQHPATNSFDLIKDNVNFGKPSGNKNGVYFYYDFDASNVKRWFINIIGGVGTYDIKIKSNGTVFDTKIVSSPIPNLLKLTTGNNSFRIQVNASASFNETISFLSDKEYYILDTGVDNKNRISLLKDCYGYLVFKVIDKYGTPYQISTNISNWNKGETHHVAISWKLNSKIHRDEMHLFIDGFEVPNIIRYGQKNSFLHEKFRSVSDEEIVGLTNKDIFASTDLVTTANSNVVSSVTNFSALNIAVGDQVIINEVGFQPSYTITNINGQHLTLNAPMPVTLTNVSFLINPTVYNVDTEVDAFSNFYLSTINPIMQGTDLAMNGTDTVYSSTNFINAGILPGYTIRIVYSGLDVTYKILQVNSLSLVLDKVLPVTALNRTYFIYDNNEIELPGLRAINPSYYITKDANYNNQIVVINNVKANSIIIIRSLGLSHKKVKTNCYVWSNNVEHVLRTRLPAPISLDSIKIRKTILDTVSVGPQNSTLSSGVFTSTLPITTDVTNTNTGRVLEVFISGTNVDFSTSVQVVINGSSNETLSFTEYGSLKTSNYFTSVNSIQVVCKPTVTTKSALNIKVSEANVITQADNNGSAPVIKYSYVIDSGVDLNSSGNVVTCIGKIFSDKCIDNYIEIVSPAPAAGFYKILSVSSDRQSLTLSQSVSLTNATFNIFEVSENRSGFQNGFIVFENSTPVSNYLLSSGNYEIEYLTYTAINFDHSDFPVIIGNSQMHQSPVCAILDSTRIDNVAWTDTRVGEVIPNNQSSITKFYNSLKEPAISNKTLVNIKYDYPIVNTAEFYTNYSIKNNFQSSEVINDDFNSSLCIINPLVIDNLGVLDTRKEGTVDFWVNSLLDSSNDPNTRFYLDAYSVVTEDFVSDTNVSIKLPNNVKEILSVRLKFGDNTNYFTGGSLQIDTSNVVEKTLVSSSANSIELNETALQVNSVTVVGDLSNKNYFEGGLLSKNGKVIYLSDNLPHVNETVKVLYKPLNNNTLKLNKQVIILGRKLPNHNSNVEVTYVPSGVVGDRISLYKDRYGNLNFNIKSAGIEHIIQAPIVWKANSWHKIRLAYKMNSKSEDQMRLFIDGYEYGNFITGTNILEGSNANIISSKSVDKKGNYTKLSFKDPVNTIMIGGDYLKDNVIYALLDNLKISSIMMPTSIIFGEARDISYQQNLSVVIPNTEDLYTTYLMNFDKDVKLNDDFCNLTNRLSGNYDFSVNVIDSFGIVNGKVKQILEILLKVLKPSNSKVFIKYTV